MALPPSDPEGGGPRPGSLRPDGIPRPSGLLLPAHHDRLLPHPGEEREPRDQSLGVPESPGSCGVAGDGAGDAGAVPGAERRRGESGEAAGGPPGRVEDGQARPQPVLGSVRHAVSAE